VTSWLGTGIPLNLFYSVGQIKGAQARAFSKSGFFHAPVFPGPLIIGLQQLFFLSIIGVDDTGEKLTAGVKIAVTQVSGTERKLNKEENAEVKNFVSVYP